jgi:hypothetical protein
VLSENGYSLEVRLLAAAVISSEMEFRRFLHRLVEYVFALAKLMVGVSIDTMSLGVAQISIRHIVKLRRVSSFEALRLTLSVKESFDLCCEIIDAFPSKDIANVVFAYNGRSSIYYRFAVERHHRYFRDSL